MVEMKMFTWTALEATAPGMVSRIRRRTSGVSCGRTRRIRAPARRTPHQHRPAWAIPEAMVAQEAA